MNLRNQLIALAVAGCSAAPACAAIFTFTGSNVGGPTFHRPTEDLSDLSFINDNVAYDAFRFSVDASGDYTFLTTAWFDAVLFLYEAPFDPSMPLANALMGHDDLLGVTTSGFAFGLDAGKTYVLVAAGFSNNDAGFYSTTIGGPGEIAPAPPVPEPGSLALMGLGLGVLGFARRYTRMSAA